MFVDAVSAAVGALLSAALERPIAMTDKLHVTSEMSSGFISTPNEKFLATWAALFLLPPSSYGDTPEKISQAILKDNMGWSGAGETTTPDPL
jgi:hypothetical protein